MLAKYGLYLKVEADNKTNFIPITEELEETIISELGMEYAGKSITINVTYSQNVNDKTSSAAIWNPTLFHNTTVGQFAVFSLMESIENRASLARICHENNPTLECYKKTEAKALPILEELIGSEKFPEVKKRLENVSDPTKIYPILDGLNLFSEERKTNKR